MKENPNLTKLSDGTLDRSKQNVARRIRRMFCSSDLFGGEREIYIRHCDQQYRLQITKAGKLILNK